MAILPPSPFVDSVSAERATAASSPPVSTGDAAVLHADYVPERFLDYAQRRSMPIISPPVPAADRDIDSIGLRAVSQALNIHPRDLDDDPPPLFQRNPSQRFIRALFDLAR